MEKLAHFKDTVSKGMNRERAKEHQKDRGRAYDGKTGNNPKKEAG